MGECPGIKSSCLSSPKESKIAFPVVSKGGSGQIGSGPLTPRTFPSPRGRHTHTHTHQGTPTIMH